MAIPERDGDTREAIGIAEAAARSGVAASTLRFYEDEGLIRAPRRISGRRVYDGAALREIEAVRLAQSAGFTLTEIKTLFTGLRPGAPAEPWKALAQAKLVALDDLIAGAEAIKRWLEHGLTSDHLRLEDFGGAVTRARPGSLAEEMNAASENDGRRRAGRPRVR